MQAAVNSVPVERIETRPNCAEHDTIVEARRGPGVIILAPPMRLMFMNASARDMLQHSEDAPPQPNRFHVRRATGVLPACVGQVVRDLWRSTNPYSEAKDLEQFEVKQAVQVNGYPLLIRAFPVVAGRGSAHTRALLLLEEIAARRPRLAAVKFDGFSLTERENAVVQCLAKGWTNKEIAQALNLALPTVKEHIRHIMEKTKTTTRTGILMKLFGQ